MKVRKRKGEDEEEKGKTNKRKKNTKKTKQKKEKTLTKGNKKGDNNANLELTDSTEASVVSREFVLRPTKLWIVVVYVENSNSYRKNVYLYKSHSYL